MIKDPLECFLDPQVVAGGCVQDSLGLSRTPRGVEDEQRSFAIQWFGFQRCVLRIDQFMPPHVAAGLHRNFKIASDSAQYQAMLDRWGLGQRLIHGLLKLQRLSAAVEPVGRDHHFGRGVLVSVGD